MLDLVVIWLAIGLPVVGLCTAVVGLAAVFYRERRVTEDAFEALDLRDLLSDSASGSAMLRDGKQAAALDAPESPFRPGVAV